MAEYFHDINELQPGLRIPVSAALILDITGSLPSLLQ